MVGDRVMKMRWVRSAFAAGCATSFAGMVMVASLNARLEGWNSVLFDWRTCPSRRITIAGLKDSGSKTRNT
jgi:predicted alpha/beta-fold hydrolase